METPGLNPSPYLLPREPVVADDVRRRVERDYDRFAKNGLPQRIEDYLRDEYQLDVAAEYAGYTIPNPWGKASGQLSMTARQVEDDVQAGLGFVVLKTVIAEDEAGSQSMKDWAIPESRMTAERITGNSGESGWTISWKGRGWWQSFDEYLQLVRDARRIAAGTQTLIVPSCKFHLPTPQETDWKTGEYDYTVKRLWDAWRETGKAHESQSVGLATAAPMPLEKDFSPTLAGSDRAAVKARILEWLHKVPELVHAAAAKAAGDEGKSAPLRLGLKLFNAVFDDDFQVEMLQEVHHSSLRADFFIYGNRLFDPQREFDGHRGIAYGGPDLSDRNLRVLSRFQEEVRSGHVPSPLPFSATGNITTGKMAVEYALRGASSFQLHTFFQLPAEQYRMPTGSKTAKALHELYFHPQTGFVLWMRHLARSLSSATAPLRFRDVVSGTRE